MGFYWKDQLSVFLTFFHIYWKNFANVLIWKQCQAGTSSNWTSVIISAALVTYNGGFSKAAKSSHFLHDMHYVQFTSEIKPTSQLRRDEVPDQEG